MKKLICTAALISGILAMTSTKAEAQQDILKGKDGEKGKSISYGATISIGGGDAGIFSIKKTDTVKINKISFTVRTKKGDTVNKVNPNKARFIGGITFTRFDIGFSKLIDNGSFSLSPTNEFLDYQPGKTSHVSFDVLQLGYRFNSNFKIYLAGGFDWNLIRLKKDITIQKNTANLSYINEPIHFDKNRLSSSYLHIPLNFELRSKQNDKYKRFYFVFGPEVSFLLNGKVKQISEERGKEKFKDDYNFAPFRYGGSLRFGYDNLGVFVKYYANDMFDSAPQKGLKNMAFGLTLGLN